MHAVAAGALSLFLSFPPPISLSLTPYLFLHPPFGIPCRRHELLMPLLIHIFVELASMTHPRRQGWQKRRKRSKRKRERKKKQEKGRGTGNSDSGSRVEPSFVCPEHERWRIS